jgi:hypothetical protein
MIKKEKYPKVKEVSDEIVDVVKKWLANTPPKTSVDEFFGNPACWADLRDNIRGRFTWILTGEGAIKRVEIIDKPLSASERDELEELRFSRDRFFELEKEVIGIFDEYLPKETYTDPFSSLRMIKTMLGGAYNSTPPGSIKFTSIEDVPDRPSDVPSDNWHHRSKNMTCATCMWYVPKHTGKIGRCRYSAPTIKGWPAMFPTDWCGSHKLDEDRA